MGERDGLELLDEDDPEPELEPELDEEPLPEPELEFDEADELRDPRFFAVSGDFFFSSTI